MAQIFLNGIKCGTVFAKWGKSKADENFLNVANPVKNIRRWGKNWNLLYNIFWK